MEVVFVSNFLNPHQYPLACELYKQSGGAYRFVEMEKMPDAFYKSGYPDYSEEPWLIRAWESPANMELAMEAARNAETLIYGSAQIEDIIKDRLAANKLTFKYSERWLKRGLLNVLSPAVRKSVSFYHRYGRGKQLYLLCASAFAAKDAAMLGTFRDKAFRWGYFPATSGAKAPEDNFSCFATPAPFKVMTVCRMLDWKRPEMAVRAAKALKENGISFSLDMYGTGPWDDCVRNEIKALGLENEVRMHGSIPNEQTHKEMQRHHCLLFTSNKREGWGAVVNEAMGNGCVVVGASCIGSVPYLIEDGKTGVIFDGNSQSDLNKKLIALASDINRCEQIARAAREKITTEWSPAEAARRILVLSKELQQGNGSPFEGGPCSVAPNLKTGWI